MNMEPLLRSVADALQDALDDVHEAQALMKQGRLSPDEPDTSQTVWHLLQSVEGNLMDTATGLRLVKTRTAHREEANDENHSASE